MDAATARVPPSGHQYEIRHDPLAATVTEVGATLREFSAGGAEVLDGFGPDEPSAGGRGQPLMPWPNRLADGRYSFGGREGRAPLDEPERHNAIHGLVRWANWTCVEREVNRLVMAHRLYPQPAFPFTLEISIGFELGSSGLTVETTATNLGTSALPFGAGFHPYLSVGTGLVDEALLTLPARSRLLSDERGLPVGSEAVKGGPFDFTRPRRIGDLRMDTAFAELERGPDGRVRAELENPSGDRGVTLWADGSFTHLMCFTGDTLADPDRRRRALALEPMTCPPNALRSGQGIVSLEPGGSFSASWGLTPR